MALSVSPAMHVRLRELVAGPRRRSTATVATGSSSVARTASRIGLGLPPGDRPDIGRPRTRCGPGTSASSVRAPRSTGSPSPRTCGRRPCRRRARPPRPGRYAQIASSLSNAAGVRRRRRAKSPRREATPVLRRDMRRLRGTDSAGGVRDEGPRGRDVSVAEKEVQLLLNPGKIVGSEREGAVDGLARLAAAPKVREGLGGIADVDRVLRIQALGLVVVGDRVLPAAHRHLGAADRAQRIGSSRARASRPSCTPRGRASGFPSTTR